MIVIILFTAAVVVGIYLLIQKLEKEEKEDFEDREN